MYVYSKIEQTLWTVGYYEPGTNKWVPESDYDSAEGAAHMWLSRIERG